MKTTKLKPLLVKPRGPIPSGQRQGSVSEVPVVTEHIVAVFAAMRAAAGPTVDLAIDVHGAIAPQTAKWPAGDAALHQ